MVSHGIALVLAVLLLISSLGYRFRPRDDDHGAGIFKIEIANALLACSLLYLGSQLVWFLRL